MSEQSQTVRIGVPKEVFPGERRVAVVPAAVAALGKLGASVCVESNAGLEAGFTDDEYREAGAEVVDDLWALSPAVDIVTMVRGAGAAGSEFNALADRLPGDCTLIASCDPLSEPAALQELATRKVRTFALEMVPRITRAQSMDVLSSMATLAGYKAVLLAAERLPRIFPMLMTAAGTITPARVLIMGAGVAGLQAIATAKRLGAVVYAYDVRPAVKEQVESLGGRFVELDLDTGDAESAGGYAKELGEDKLARQQELMAKVVADADVVVTTAAIPGKKAPILVTEKMVEGMRPGSVIVDLAAERGGNCEICSPGETIEKHGVTVIGPLNVPSSIPAHASEMLSKNVTTFLGLIVKDGAVAPDLEDEILRDTMVTADGDVPNSRIRELLSLPALAAPEPPAESEATADSPTIPLAGSDDSENDDSEKSGESESETPPSGQA